MDSCESKVEQYKAIHEVHGATGSTGGVRRTAPARHSPGTEVALRVAGGLAPAERTAQRVRRPVPHAEKKQRFVLGAYFRSNA